MAEEEETTVLGMQIKLDPQEVIKGVKRLQKETSKRFKVIEQSEDKVNKNISRYIQKMGQVKRVLNPTIQRQAELYKDTSRAIAESRAELEKMTKDIVKQEETLAALKKRMEGGDSSVKDEIKAVEELHKKKVAAFKQATTRSTELHDALSALDKIDADARKAVEIKPELAPDAMREAGQELLKPFASFARRDLAGFMEEGASLAVKSLRGMRNLGKMDTKDSNMGGMLKGIAGLGKALAPILDTLAKFAPMLKLAGSFAMGLVQVFIGAEGAATEFNKEILSTAGSAGFLKRNMGDVTKGVRDATEYMHDLYGQTAQLKNLARGVSKEMQSATLSQLGAEGQDLPRLDRELRNIRESSNLAAKSITDMSDVTFMSLAYSRQFGVSLSEITQLQGEMMTEMGMNLTTVKTEFQNLDRAAEQAGIQTGKFFGIIRSFSADLSLFSLRMADVTKVMMVLGKTMSPRNAQKFLQTVTQQFKGASLMDRTKSVILGGKGEMKGIAQEDMDRRIAAMGMDLSTVLDPKELASKIKGGDTKALAEYLSQFGDKISGAQSEAIFDAARMQSKLASNDTVDIASAIKDASPIAAIEMLQQISEKRFGKPLEELKGIQRIAIENMAGINDEQIDQMYKMNAGLIKTQTDLAAKIEAFQKARASGMSDADARQQAGLTETETGMMQKLGVDLNSANAAQEVRDKDANSIWNSMDTSQKDLLKASDKTEEYQARTTSLQTSLTDRMGQLVDFVITKFYTLVMNIYDAIMGMWDSLPFGGPKKEIKSWAGQEKGVAATEEQKTQHTQLRELVMGMSTAQRDAYNAEIKKSGGRGKLSLEQQFEKALQFVDPAKAKAAQESSAKAMEATKRATGAVTAPAAPVEVEDGPTEASQEDTTNSVDKVNKTLKKGVPLAKPSSDYNSAIENSTLGAIRQGLFEYYMYSGLDRTMVAAGLRSGAFTPGTFGQKIAGTVGEAGSPNAALANLVSPNADGGVVASITNGKANVNRLPAGEGWAAVGPGERIMPAGSRGGGGGTTKIELELKGDLRRFVDARVVEGTANFERNKRLR